MTDRIDDLPIIKKNAEARDLSKIQPLLKDNKTDIILLIFLFVLYFVSSLKYFEKLFPNNFYIFLVVKSIIFTGIVFFYLKNKDKYV